MAHAIKVDTLAFSKKLRAAGADERLADAIVEGFTTADTSELATKADLKEVETALRHEIGEVRHELTAEIGKVRNELKAEIHEVRNDLKWIKGYGAVIVAILVVPILSSGAVRVLAFIGY